MNIHTSYKRMYEVVTLSSNVTSIPEGLLMKFLCATTIGDDITIMKVYQEALCDILSEGEKEIFQKAFLEVYKIPRGVQYNNSLKME